MFRQAFMMFCNREIIGGACTYAAAKLLLRQQERNRMNEFAQSSPSQTQERLRTDERQEFTQARTYTPK